MNNSVIPENGKTKDFTLTFIQVISALAVVTLHTNGCFWQFSATERYWFTANIIECLCYFAVPVFFMITGIISVCALINAVALPVNTIVFKFLDYNNVTAAISPMPSPSISFILFSAAITFIIGLLVIFRHKENIQRLANGTEKKIKAKK